MRIQAVAHALLLVLLGSGCAEDTAQQAVALGPFDYSTEFSELPERQWSEVVLDVDGTGCVYGEDYSFWVYPGDPEKVIFEFSGGGACWNEFTCSVEAGIFDQSLDDDRRDFTSVRPPGLRGHNNARNPFLDWTHVYLPYCTGDIHIGDQQTDYGTTNARHYGGTNTQSVIDWADRAGFPATQVMVGGCSAGGYAAAIWSPTFFDMYPDARKTTLSDGSVGVIGPLLEPGVFGLWREDGGLPLPDWAAESVGEVTTISETLTSVYRATSEKYPDVVLAQSTTLEDSGQKFFYGLSGGGTGADFNERQLELMRGYRDAVSNYRYVIGSGFGHCMVDNSGFYVDRTEEVFYRDWLYSVEARATEEDLLCPECDDL